MGDRKMTPKGQMSRGANSQPAVMMMPPHIRATFVPNPPLKYLPPIKKKRLPPMTGVFQLLKEFENTPPPPRRIGPTPKSIKEQAKMEKQRRVQQELEPTIEEYRKLQRECGGIFHGMNCYNTLFVGRLAYEVTERKLLREMEHFGPVKDIKLVTDPETGKSKGYAFVEYENEEDMKRAYRAADGMRLEGRSIVVDVERGHTVPTWLPRRLGGGLGGTRIGGKDKNVTIPGRYDPSRPELSRPLPMAPPPPPIMMDGPVGGGPPPPPMGMGRGRGGFGGDRGGYGGPYGGPPPPPPPENYGPYGGGGGGGGGYGVGPPPDRRRRRSRSRSPDRGRYAPRPRY
ncbi:RNP-1 like RNA-binding protein [Nitzschia inconspicua]|uniref:RNP-1 like RNA-binding protein n=1 Tax=Nitzschia inconspicua TaxID=303405 RepID=A0A9K3M0D1_9STRA|nr:RNP-1 like RNA-binding protein [Nitzschia inconspicua]